MALADDGRRFARLDELFQAALDRPVDERDGWLNDQTDDLDLLAEVRALLWEDQATAAADLEGIVDASARSSWSPDRNPAAITARSSRDDTDHREAEGDAPKAGEDDPETVGPYRIVGRLGRGGQATVYLAERTGEFSMPVALKHIRRGMDTDDILERLRLERQILARLIHPNIGRIYDGGSDEHGRPYLVMEVIEGQRIDRWCAERQLPARERLRLFLQACEAVDFAHQNLILHRDLKPSNILVTDDGVVKLLDFGIAKVLTGDSVAESTLTIGQATVTGNRLLTPDYASPEQLLGSPLTTASDVYSLGIVLFHLLSGRLPHAGSGMASTFARWDGELRDSPSVLRAAREERSAHNQLTVPADRWLKSAGFELGVVVAKALEVEPARRYNAVRDLADDVLRLLEDRPVLARKPSLGYRLGKLARRHRVGVWLATLALLSLLAAIVGTGWQAAVARGERQRAEEERTQAEGVLALFFEMFEVTDPFSEAQIADGSGAANQPLGETVTAHELLDSAAQRIGAGLGDDWSRQARLRRAVARAYFNLSLFDRARGQLEATVRELAAVPTRFHGDSELEVARVLVTRDLGRLDAYQGFFDQAERRLLAAEDQLTALGTLPAEVATTIEHLGELEILRGEPDAAETYYEAAMILQRALSGERSPAVARVQVGLAKVRAQQSQPAEMASLLREALAVRTESLGDQHPLVLETLNDLAVASRDALDFAAAERIFVDLLSRQRLALGRDHAHLAPTLYNLATALERLGRTAEAETRLIEAWQITERAAGDRHLATKILLLQGLLRERANDAAAAAAFYQRALAIRRQLFGDQHPRTLRALLRLGGLWAKLGDRRAEPLLREAISAPALWAEGTTSAYLALGELALATGQPEVAAAELRRGLGSPGSTGWMKGRMEFRLGQAFETLGKRAEAGAAARRARALLGEALGEAHPWAVEVDTWLESRAPGSPRAID